MASQIGWFTNMGLTPSESFTILVTSYDKHQIKEPVTLEPKKVNEKAKPCDTFVNIIDQPNFKGFVPIPYLDGDFENSIPNKSFLPYNIDTKKTLTDIYIKLIEGNQNKNFTSLRENHRTTFVEAPICKGAERVITFNINRAYDYYGDLFKNTINTEHYKYTLNAIFALNPAFLLLQEAPLESEIKDFYEQLKKNGYNYTPTLQNGELSRNVFVYSKVYENLVHQIEYKLTVGNNSYISVYRVDSNTENETRSVKYIFVNIYLNNDFTNRIDKITALLNTLTYLNQDVFKNKIVILGGTFNTPLYAARLPKINLGEISDEELVYTDTVHRILQNFTFVDFFDLYAYKYNKIQRQHFVEKRPDFTAWNMLPIDGLYVSMNFTKRYYFNGPYVNYSSISDHLAITVDILPNPSANLSDFIETIENENKKNANINIT